MTDPDPIALCLAEQISPPVMVARMILAGYDSKLLQQALAKRPDAGTLLSFVASRTAAIDRVHAMLTGVDHEARADVSRIAAQFDTAVATEPEASVAAYSLGDPALLAQATAEVLDWLIDRNLLQDGMDVLDLGCGFGRIAAALAPRAASVLGLDISARMIDEAHRRYASLSNVRFVVTAGERLNFLQSTSRDLVLAVDCFPYLLQAGLAEAHIVDVARVLRPHGALVILNLSYAVDTSSDRQRAVGWAAGAGLRLEQDGVRPFTLWDATAFVFRRGADHIPRPS